MIPFGNLIDVALVGAQDGSTSTKRMGAMNTGSLTPFVHVHRDIRIRGEYIARDDWWIAHFDLPRPEGGFQTAIHYDLPLSPGPHARKASTAAEARSLAISTIDAHLDRR
jgi:hypothetical protein